MLKGLHPIVDIFKNDEFLPIPRCSFICKFSEPYINQQNKRIIHVQAVTFNKNIFCPYKNFDQVIASFKDRVQKLNIIFVYPGEYFNEGKFVLKYGSHHTVCMMSVKALGTHNIHLYKPENLFVFVEFISWQNLTIQMLHYHNLLLSGCDSSRRHLVPDLTINLLDDICILTNRHLHQLKGLGLRYNIPKKLVNPSSDLANLKKVYIDPYKDCTPPAEILQEITKTSSILSKMLDVSNVLSHEYKNRNNSKLDWTNLENSKEVKMDNITLKKEGKSNFNKKLTTFNSTQKRSYHTEDLTHTSSSFYSPYTSFINFNMYKHITYTKPRNKSNFPNSTRLFIHNNGFNNNSNNETGRNNRISNLWKNVYKFILRIIISMIVAILSKTLFLCWYNNSYSWLEFFENLNSLSSFLAGIGTFAGISIGKLLDFTPLKINIKKFLFDPLLITLKKLFLSWKEGVALVLNQDRNPIKDQPGGNSSIGSQPGPESPTTPSGSQVQPNEAPPKSSPIRTRSRPYYRRSPYELAEARKDAKFRYPQKPGESDKEYDIRINKGESSRYSSEKKLNNTGSIHKYAAQRTPEMLEKARAETRLTLDKEPGESDEAFTERVNKTESSRHNKLKNKSTTTTHRSQKDIFKSREIVRNSLVRLDGETDEAFEKRVKNRDSYLNSTGKGVGGSCKFSTFSNSTKHSGYDVKMMVTGYRPTYDPLTGDKDLGKTSFKSYSTYSQNVIFPYTQREGRAPDSDKKLNNDNDIFLKRAIYNFIKASINNLIPGVHFQDSTTLIVFLIEFDSDFKISRQSIHNYRKRKLVFKSFFVNTDVSRFLAYVKSRFPKFNFSAFLEKYSGTSMP